MALRHVQILHLSFIEVQLVVEKKCMALASGVLLILSRNG
jgi:hypothetical protein